MRPWKNEEEMLRADAEAKATLRLEGIEFTPEEDELHLRHARGEISDSEFREIVLALAKKRSSKKA